MPRLDSSIVIDRPIDQTFEFTTDPANETRWTTLVVESEVTSNGSYGVGSTGRTVIRFLGRVFESTWEVTEYEPPQKISFRSITGPLQYAGTETYESVDGGTRLRYVMDTRLDAPGLFGRLGDTVLARLYQRALDAQLERLRDVLESEASEQA